MLQFYIYLRINNHLGLWILESKVYISFFGLKSLKMVILISWVFHTPVGGEKGYKIIISLKYMEILVLDLLVCIKEIKLMNKTKLSL